MSVSPRASKEEFMAALGLSTQDPQHEQYYRAMRVQIPHPPIPQSLPIHNNPTNKIPQKDEAISTYNHLNEDPSNLLDIYRTTKPPYFWHHIRPERQRWGINEIARNASPLTRPLFARGMTSGEYGPNWVAGRASSPQMVLRYDGGASAAASAGGGSGAANSGKKEYYDPVRNG
ncbi:hypothetical protein AAWM_06440 [Aspergillus awamori]|uniref:Uncharacterized protein n=1 Tax=Aspergillus awamori TaxID=105351 RepID=A0A401KWB4_ASPAW|nr:hypothetical protein AAWM_06440 [Aspergillus awamori]